MTVHHSESNTSIDFLREVFDRCSGQDAIIWQDRPHSYAWLHNRVNHWRDTLSTLDILERAVVLLDCDFSPNGVALLLALIERGCIIVPVTAAVAAQRDEFASIAQTEVVLTVDGSDEVRSTPMNGTADHEYYETLRESGHAGLVLFSSGSTGKSKAAVHDFTKLLNKFKSPRRRLRAITFLLFDHIGGINTLLYTLSNGGCVVTVQDRSPENILRAVEQFEVELLPVSPTFLSLVLLDGAHERHDLSSLKTVTYGTEPMPESTLRRFGEACPHVNLQQTYGLSEVGILRSRSKDSQSLWMKVGGSGFETRVVDDILHIKAESAMMGYLNAPSPFTPDGWMNTGDSVEVDGQYIRVLGRQSESINVGGEKVHPAEVESVIQEMTNVAEVTVHGAPNAITGNIVCARVRLREPEERSVFRGRLKQYCKDRMAAFKIPVKVTTDDKEQFSARFKKKRAEPS